MAAISFAHPPARRRFRPMRLVLAAVAVLATAGLAQFGGFGGNDLRGELTGAAAQLQALPTSTPKAKVRNILSAGFTGRNVAIDARKFPDLVLVTVRNLNRRACVAAENHARRIEGLVVVQLEGHGKSADCGAQNTLTWRLMP